MVSITPEGFFAVLAAIVAVGFVLDYFFSRTRITSILPLMLLGLVLVQTGLIGHAQVNDLRSISGFVSAFAVAVILLTVGLEINLVRLYAIFGRALGWTLGCQITTGVVLGFIAYYTFGWSLLFCMVFGFAVSGPSSIVVQALVRRMTMKEELKTTLLFEAVVSDVLQLVVPTILILIFEQGTVSGADIGRIVSLAVFGSIALGVAAGLLWVWALDRARHAARGYTWALTFTFALGLFAVTVYTDLTGSLVIFLFGVIVGNAALLDARRGIDPTAAHNRTERGIIRLRRFLRLSSESIDVGHIHEVQVEISYIVGVFFFFYIGTLYVQPAPDFVFTVPAVAVLLMIAIRWGFVPILNPLFDSAPRLRSEERGLAVMNVPRGLSAAVVATLVISLPGANVPGFLDAVFVTILLTNVVATIGVFLFYRPARTQTTPAPAASVAGQPDAPAGDSPIRGATAGVPRVALEAKSSSGSSFPTGWATIRARRTRAGLETE